MKKLLPLFFCFPLLLLAGAQSPMQYAPFMVRPVAASGRTWFPTNQTGYPIMAWYVASDYTTNTTPVLQDRTANAFNLTNLAANTAWPTTSGGALVFDGTSDYLTQDAFIWGTNCEALIVCKLKTFEVGGGIVAATNGSTRLRLWNSSGNSIQGSDGNVSATFTGLDAGITNQWLVLSFIRTNTSGGNFQITVNTNGANVVVGSSGTGAGTNYGLNLGTTYSRTFGWANMEFREAVFLPTNLTSTIRSQWVTELRAIYGF